MKMQQSEALKLDRFRLVAAILVVGIHVAPFDSISVELDYYLTYCIGRIGVPYFLMLTGYFVLSAYQSEQYREKIRRLVLKLGIMYGCVTILYLPINWYAGKLPHGAGGDIPADFSGWDILSSLVSAGNGAGLPDCGTASDAVWTCENRAGVSGTVHFWTAGG